MQSRGTLTLTLSLLGRERGTFGGTVSGSPNRDPRRVRLSSPLPARSGERIIVAVRVFSLPLLAATKAMAGADQAGYLDGRVFVVSLGRYARCHLVLDSALPAID